MQVALHEAAVVKTDAERQAAMQKQGMMRYSDWCTMWARMMCSRPHHVFTLCVHAMGLRKDRQQQRDRQRQSER